MGIDTVIAMGFRPPQIQTRTNALAEIAQLQQGQQQNQLAQMKMQEYQTGLEEKQALKSLLNGLAPDATPESVTTALTRGGHLTEAKAYAESASKVSKDKRDAEKAQLEGHLKKFEITGQIMSGVKDQASWELARQQTAQVFGPEAAALMPAQYDPALIEQKRLQALTVKDQLEQKWKAMEYTTPKADAVLSSQTSRQNNQETNATSRANNSATVGATIRGQNMTDARSRETNAAGQYDGDRGLLIDKKTGLARPVMGADGQPIVPKGSEKMTEDQGKATGWLVQAENAFKNMKASGFDKNGNAKGAAYPGINDAIAQLPGGAPLANSMRSGDRQKFIQASSSLSESLLRAATGAGVNESEARQKIQELTPLFGEDAGTTKQKMEAIPLYIESLKVRAGPGAKKAAAVSAGGASGQWGIQKVN